MRPTHNVLGAKRSLYQSPPPAYPPARCLAHPIPRRSIRARKGRYYGIPDRDTNLSVSSVPSSSPAPAQAVPTPNAPDMAAIPLPPSPAPVLAPDAVHSFRPETRSFSRKRMSPMRRFLLGAGQLFISKFLRSRRSPKQIFPVIPEPEPLEASESFIDVKGNAQHELLHGNALMNDDDKLFLDQIQQLDLCHRIRTEFEEGRKGTPICVKFAPTPPLYLKLTKEERTRREAELKKWKATRNTISLSTTSKRFESYEAKWNILSVPNDCMDIICDAFPWPLLEPPCSPRDFTDEHLRCFFFHPLRPHYEGVSNTQRISIELRRWIPHNFNNNVLPKIRVAHQPVALNLARRIDHFLKEEAKKLL